MGLRLGSVNAWHSSIGRQPNFASLNRRLRLYSAGRPSRWALAHILVECLLKSDCNVTKNIHQGFSVAGCIQDTVIALQALAAFASLTMTPAGDTSGGIQLTATYGNETHRFAPITRENALLLQIVQVSNSAAGIT